MASTTRSARGTIGSATCTTAPDRHPTTEPSVRFHDAATVWPVVSPTTTTTATTAQAAGSSGNPSASTTSVTTAAPTTSRTSVRSHGPHGPGAVSNRRQRDMPGAYVRA